MAYEEYLQVVSSKSSLALKEILKQQTLQGYKLEYPQDKVNVLLMISNNLLALNGNTDLNFALNMVILDDKKVWKTCRKHYDRLLQEATMNENLTLLLSLFIKRYSNLQLNTLSEEDKMTEMMFLMNMKGNLNEEQGKFVENFIIPFINILIFESEGMDDMLKINLTLLFENLNREVTDNTDFIYISDYIFKLLKSRKIIG